MPNMDEHNLRNLTVLISQTSNTELKEKLIRERDELLVKMGVLRQ